MFWVFFLSHTAPGLQLWFYFHLCMWVIHWGLFLRLPWRTCAYPFEGQVWKWCSCLSLRGSGSTMYSGELVAREAGNVVLWKGMATSIGQYAPVFLPGEPPWQRSLTGHSLQGRKESDTTKATLCAALPQWELTMKVVQLPGSWGLWWYKVWSDTDCLFSSLL